MMGSAHTALAPYWAEVLNKEVLNKEVLTAVQLSARKGYWECRVLGDRGEIRGRRCCI